MEHADEEIAERRRVVGVEGKMLVVLEAAAAAKPVITTTATGAVDSILGGRSGLLVEPRDVASLRAAMRLVAENPSDARSMGQFGKEFAAKHFSNPIIWGQLKDYLACPANAGSGGSRKCGSA